MISHPHTGTDGSAGTPLEGAMDKVVVPWESSVWVPTQRCVPVPTTTSGHLVADGSPLGSIGVASG